MNGILVTLLFLTLVGGMGLDFGMDVCAVVGMCGVPISTTINKVLRGCQTTTSSTSCN
jgi:hypothetical protein